MQARPASAQLTGASAILVYNAYDTLCGGKQKMTRIAWRNPSHAGRCMAQPFTRGALHGATLHTRGIAWRNPSHAGHPSHAGQRSLPLCNIWHSTAAGNITVQKIAAFTAVTACIHASATEQMRSQKATFVMRATQPSNDNFIGMVQPLDELFHHCTAPRHPKEASAQ
jgi:hypothetical protein